MSNHGESSVHGKLDSIMECQKQLAERQGALEKAIIGTADSPGLCEKVRVLQSENAKQTAIISTSISAVLIATWGYVRNKLGLP